MSLLIDSVTKDLSPWIQAFKSADPTLEIVTWDDHPDFSSVTTAVVWNHRKELLPKLTNLKLIASLGAGVDHILSDQHIPKDVKITRIISEELTRPMTNFCLGAILYYQRQFDKYANDKINRTWDQQFNPEREMNVGILGLGELGSDVANKLLPLGFNVFGLSRTRKSMEGVQTFDMNELDVFLERINILCVMLPATKETKDILNKRFFEKMKKGSFLINVARGHHQVNEDIIDALDQGILDGAFLDVFPEEPLPKDNPLWTHPKVFITPHIAVVTKLEAAIPQIVKNHYDVLKNEPLFGLVDLERGY